MTKAETLQKYLPCHATYGDFDLCVECPYNPNPGKIWEYGCAHGQDKMIDDAIDLLKEQEEQIKNRDESLEKALEEIKWLRGMLKEQEPRVMTRLEIEQSKERIVWLEDDQFNSYALVDGIDQRNGWVWLSTFGNMGLQQRRDCENYGKRWRCWTKRPTEDQRKAVKLE